MGYNYGLECKIFREKWDKLRLEYAVAGMSDADIQTMYDFDWEQLKAERVFYTHNQPLGGAFPDGDDAGEDNSPLVHEQPEHLSARQPEIAAWGFYDWIEDIDTPELAERVKGLSQTDLEVLSYRVTDAARALSQAEIAYRLGVSRAAVTKRFNRIKSGLEKFRRQG